MLLHQFLLFIAIYSAVLCQGQDSTVCEKDDELEQLVASPGTKTILYMLYHDDISERVARKFAYCKEHWIKPVRLTASPFFETIIYKDLFPSLEHEWKNYDFVITATYKTIHRLELHKNIYYTQDFNDIKHKLITARDGNYDFVPFLRSYTGLIDSIMYWHGPDFKVAWDNLLLKLGYSSEIIRSFDAAKPFYRNIFIVRPKVLRELCFLMMEAMQVVINDPETASYFEKDAKYAGGKEEVAMKVYGTPFYQLHPFIFERLPSFLLNVMGVNLCMAKDGPCHYNY